MQLAKFWLKIFILFSLMFPALAAPPFQVLQTCMNGEPYDENSTIKILEGDGYTEKSWEGCEDQYDRLINGRSYGTVFCNDKFFIIINDKKLDPELAENFSINPEIEPGVPFTPRSSWYEINYNHTPYLCISAPLAEQGAGSSRNQYYIVENAFDTQLTPILYYYFFEKNIAPITSKTL